MPWKSTEQPWSYCWLEETQHLRSLTTSHKQSNTETVKRNSAKYTTPKWNTETFTINNAKLSITHKCEVKLTEKIIIKIHKNLSGNSSQRYLVESKLLHKKSFKTCLFNNFQNSFYFAIWMNKQLSMTRAFQDWYLP